MSLFIIPKTYSLRMTLSYLELVIKFMTRVDNTYSVASEECKTFRNYL